MRPRLSITLAHILLALCATPRQGRGQDEDLAKELPRIKATELADALRTFKIHDGFRLEPVAVEPVVADPVAVCFDADGRLYVVEMRGYPFPEKVPSGGVSLLEDEDGDGRFEKSTMFVEGLSWPTGIVPFDGGVFIAAAPDILYAKDLNGDGKADVKKVVFTGFGSQNVQGLLNGLLWGPDGWIYGASGGNGGEIKNLLNPMAKPVALRVRDFRFKPNGSAFEAISGGGQFGHSFDDWGHRFVCNNSNNIRQVVLPSRYLERNPALTVPAVLTDIAEDGGAGPVFRISAPEPWRVVRTRQRLADPAIASRLAPTEKFAFGFFTSATGITIYRGTAFPPAYRGDAFIGDVGGNLVHRKTVTKAGSIFSAQRSDQGVEFLASTDNWFRPVNFLNTPDGTLLVLDMYRETIEHPASIPEPIKKHLDLTSGRDRGRIYAIVPEGFKRRGRPGLTKVSSLELVPLLADRDSWWRETAQRLLIERNDRAVVPDLKSLAKSRPTPLGRLHALWTLAALGALESADLQPAFSDGEPGVREQAARLAEALVGNEPSLQDALLRLADDADAMVRFQAAFSLGEVKGRAAIGALSRLAVRDSNDRWVHAAVESSIAGRVWDLLEELANADGFLARREGKVWLSELAVLIGAENRPEATKALLSRFAGTEADSAQARVVVLGLGKGLQRVGGSLRALLDGPASKSILPLFETAAHRASEEGESARRVEAIRLLALGPLDVAFAALPALLDAKQPGPVQLAALQTLAEIPDRRVAPLIVEHWKALGPTARREAAEVLLARPERLSVLLGALESGQILPVDLDPARRTQLLASRTDSIRMRAVKILGTTAKSNRGDVIKAYHNSLTLPSDRTRGRDLFRKHCATCHKAEGVGTDVGPNLATVTGRTPDDLLIHILDPNREVAPIYQNYTVAMDDGRVVSGLIVDESANALTLRRAEGVTDVVPRSRIEQVSSTGVSLMPENLEQSVDVQGMADLIAYIRSIQAAGPAPVAR
jgi:putative membrane-bound dehydrogenase-like protein